MTKIVCCVRLGWLQSDDIIGTFVTRFTMVSPHGCGVVVVMVE